MTYRPDIHHRRTIRLAGYDYARPGAYFVTICARARECIFSSPRIAHVVAGVWRSVVSVHGPIDEFVVMPNHLHGIIWIGESGTPVGAQQQHHFGAHHRLPLATTGVHCMAHGDVAAPLRWHAFTQRPVESGSLSAIVRTFKSATAKRINRLRSAPGATPWQRSYYEHIIRDEDDLYRIRQYIRDNPSKWNEDALNPLFSRR